MKKTTWLTILLCSSLAMSTASLTVCAASELNASDLEAQQAISAEDGEDISSVLTTFIRERQNAKNYELSSAGEADEDPGDFTGFDVSAGHEVYILDIGGLLYKEGGSFVPMEMFQTTLDCEPMMMVPFTNGHGRGTSWMYRNADTGAMTLYSSMQSDMFDYDFEDIVQRSAQLDNVTDVKLMQYEMLGMNLVYIVADSKEYVIPYFVKDNFAEWYGENLPTALYRASDFADWLNYSFDWTPTEELLFGGLPYIGGYTVTPFDPEAEKSRISLTAVAAVTGAAGIGLAAFAAVQLVKQKKSAKNAE